MLRKLILPLWLVFAVLLFLYSFTQIDLSLTFSQVSIWQYFQKSFQYLGYFERQLSTRLFVSLVTFGFILYVTTLYFAYKDKITIHTIWKVVLILGVVLFVSYNALSYDFFNYIFDAKIVTRYHLNPYQYKALDFPQDPMLSFMHSTHRVYPYGPSWLALTVPVSFLGGNIFIITFYLFKALFLGSYLGSVYIIQKILKRAGYKNIAFGVVLFALNPLVLVEGLISAHNDLVMMFLALLAFYFLFLKRPIIAYAVLLVSIGIKFTTLLLLPIFLYVSYKYYKGRTIHIDKILYIAFIVMVFAVIAVSLASGQNKNPELQPWYLLSSLTFLPFVTKRVFIILSVVISFGLLLSYAPFLAFGIWPGDIVQLKNNIAFACLVVGIVVSAFLEFNVEK